MRFTDYDKLYRTAEHFRNVIGDESSNIMTTKHSSNTTAFSSTLLLRAFERTNNTTEHQRTRLFKD
jgi:hypothetical protein